MVGKDIFVYCKLSFWPTYKLPCYVVPYSRKSEKNLVRIYILVTLIESEFFLNVCKRIVIPGVFSNLPSLIRYQLQFSRRCNILLLWVFITTCIFYDGSKYDEMISTRLFLSFYSSKIICSSTYTLLTLNGYSANHNNLLFIYWDKTII